MNNEPKFQINDYVFFEDSTWFIEKILRKLHQEKYFYHLRKGDDVFKRTLAKEDDVVIVLRDGHIKYKGLEDIEDVK